jgi:hypothetical protein
VGGKFDGCSRWETCGCCHPGGPEEPAAEAGGMRGRAGRRCRLPRTRRMPCYSRGWQPSSKRRGRESQQSQLSHPLATFQDFLAAQLFPVQFARHNAALRSGSRLCPVRQSSDPFNHCPGPAAAAI